MIRNKPQIPERTPILSFPTPGGKADMAFFEMRDGSLPKNKEWTYGDSHPDGANFPHHELVFVASDGSDPVWQRWFYAAKRELQHLYNWEYSDTSDWPRITQTFLVKRGDFSPTATFDMPPLEYFPYPAEYSATGLEERPIGDETLASLYVTVVITRERLYKRTVAATLFQVTTTLNSTAITHDTNTNVPVAGQLLEGIGISPGTTGTRVSNTSTTLSIPAYATGTGISVELVTYQPLAIVGYEFDPDTGSMKPYQRTKVPVGTTGTVIQPNGSFSEIQPASTLWSIKTTKQATGLPGIAVNGVASRTFKMVVQWSWPRVLDYITIKPVKADADDFYSAVTGYITTPIFLSEGYSGPCLATIIETWTSKLPKTSLEGGSADWDSNSLSTVYPLLEQPSVLLPRAIDFNSPKLNVSVGECLHENLDLYYNEFYQLYKATSPVRWPASLLASVDLRPYQGGWLKKVMIVDAPIVEGMQPAIQVSSSAVSGNGFTLSWASTVAPAYLAVNPALSVLVGNSALSLDISTDPTFIGASLAGYPMSLTVGTLTKVLTDVPRGRNYYCRVTSTKTIVIPFVSSIVTVFPSPIHTVALPPQAEILVYAGATLIPKTTGTLAFGTVYQGVDSIKTLTITNPGLLTLTDLAITFSGTNLAFCSVVGTLPTSIAAGESASVQIKVNATSIPAGGGVLAAVAAITSNATASPSYAFDISGTVTAAEINVRYSSVSYASGSSIDLPGLTVGGNYTDYTLTIENTGAGNLTVSAGITSGDSAWSVLTAPTTPVAGAGSTTVVVRFTPNTDGESGAVLTITNNDLNEGSYVLYLVAQAIAKGTLQLTNPWGGIQATGSSFDFGRIAFNTSRTLNFTLTNVGVGVLYNIVVGLSGTNAARFSVVLNESAINPTESLNLAIQWTPANAGAQTAIVTITSSDAATPSYTLNLSAFALAADTSAPQCQVEYPAGTAITTLDFGSQIFTGGTNKIVTVRNIGSASQTGILATISGTNSGDWTRSGMATSLVAGATDDFTLTFNPKGYGLRTANVAITSNADTFNVALTGVGVAATSLLTGQSAGVFIGQTSATAQDITASSRVVSRPEGIAISSTGRLAVCDYNSNRVLIWDKVPTTSGVAADLVLGQVNFTSTGSDCTDVGLSGPRGICWQGSNLWVCDSSNNRVLRYTNPISNGQAATLVLGQSNFTTSYLQCTPNGMYYPTAVITYGTKLIVADTNNSRVLVFNTIPISNAANATFALGPPAGGSNLLIPGSASPPSASSLSGPEGLAVTRIGNLVVADTGNSRVLIYSGMPSAGGASASFALGQPAGGSNLTSNAAVSNPCTALGMYRPISVAVSSSGQFAVGDSYNNRVLLWYQTPTSVTAPHAVLGQTNFTSGDQFGGQSIGAAGINGIRDLKWNGTSLLVSCFTPRIMKFSPAT